jgi:hypothetical protein
VPAQLSSSRRLQVEPGLLLILELNGLGAPPGGRNQMSAISASIPTVPAPVANAR